MKTPFHFMVGTFIAVVIASGIMASQAAPPEPKSKSDPRMTESNAIPQSIFTVPTSPAEGRDPFFPNRATGGVAPKKGPVTSEVALVLNGLSGIAEHRLAIINGRTFGEGESGEVPTASGRERIRCVQIKTESVIVELASGERRELRLRD